MFVSSGAGLEERGLNAEKKNEHLLRVSRLAMLLPVLLAMRVPLLGQKMPDGASALPDAPSALLAAAAEGGDPQHRAGRNASEPCEGQPQLPPGSPPPLQGPPPCEKNPIQPIVTLQAKPLDTKEKGWLAVRDFIDPFNLMTIAGYSAIVVASNAHSSYGSGMAGFGRLTGYGLAQDGQGEFFETFAIPSLLHQDPRYHRVPGRPFNRRLLHAVAHTFISQHDDGTTMPNYATLLTYPLSAELSNFYVPGLQTDAASTTRRVAIGLATDPAGSIVAEFLPDVARHIHIHIVFVQEILNQMITGAPATTQ